MRFFSKSAKQKKSFVKTAQGFYPLHHTDNTIENDFFNPNMLMTQRQQNMLGLVMQNPSAGVASPLLDLVMNPAKFQVDKFVSNGDKELLIRAWESSKSISMADNKTGDRLLISSQFDMKDLNRLKASGLIAGFGSEVTLTKKGKDTLVKLMLEEDSGLIQKAASNISRIIKHAITQSERSFNELANNYTGDMNRNREFLNDPATESQQGEHFQNSDNTILDNGDDKDLANQKLKYKGRYIRRNKKGEWII